MTTYTLPDGYALDADREAPGGWNGWPVPVVGADAYFALRAHLELDADGRIDPDAPRYSAPYVPGDGWHLDGLTWERASRVLAVLDDPNYAPSDLRDRAHVFLFDSLTAARDALASLDAGAGWGYLTTLDGRTLGMAQFGYLSEPVLTCWTIEGDADADPVAAWQALADDADPYPDYRIERPTDADTGATIEGAEFEVTPC